MFKEWGFLLTEIWVLLALAALIGLFAGWLIWGGRAASQAELFRLQTQLDRERARTKAALAGPDPTIPAMQGGGYRRPQTAPAPVAAVVDDTPRGVTPEDEIPQAASTLDVSSLPKPEGLDAPRDGIPDDLTKISGIGAKLAQLCNDLGYFHYDQIAAWTADEVAWVDENLQGFKGRVSRDAWVDQARVLAKNPPQ